MSAPLSFAELQRLERLVEWNENSARSCDGLVAGLEREGLFEAAKNNRSRAKAHTDTARFLMRLLPHHDSEATTFRDHLKPKDRAQIRAPP